MTIRIPHPRPKPVPPQVRQMENVTVRAIPSPRKSFCENSHKRGGAR